MLQILNFDWLTGNAVFSPGHGLAQERLRWCIKGKKMPLLGRGLAAASYKSMDLKMFTIK